jgi:hypothetical protein
MACTSFDLSGYCSGDSCDLASVVVLGVACMKLEQLDLGQRDMPSACLSAAGSYRVPCTGRTSAFGTWDKNIWLRGQNPFPRKVLVDNPDLIVDDINWKLKLFLFQGTHCVVAIWF